MSVTDMASKFLYVHQMNGLHATLYTCGCLTCLWLCVLQVTSLNKLVRGWNYIFMLKNSEKFSPWMFTNMGWGQIPFMSITTHQTHVEMPWMPWCVYTWTINEPHLPYKTGLDVMQSHPLRRTCFSQYQASSAALGWPGDTHGVCMPVALCVASHISQQFSPGTKLHTVEQETFEGENFRRLLIFAAPKNATAQISQRKLSRIATKPQNSWKFSPSKISRYTVLMSQNSEKSLDAH